MEDIVFLEYQQKNKRMDMRISEMHLMYCTDIYHILEEPPPRSLSILSNVIMGLLHTLLHTSVNKVFAEAKVLLFEKGNKEGSVTERYQCCSILMWYKIGSYPQSFLELYTDLCSF